MILCLGCVNVWVNSFQLKEYCLQVRPPNMSYWNTHICDIRNDFDYANCAPHTSMWCFNPIQLRSIEWSTNQISRQPFIFTCSLLIEYSCFCLVSLLLLVFGLILFYFASLLLKIMLMLISRNIFEANFFSSKIDWFS